MNRTFVTALFLLVNLLPLMAQKNLLRKLMQSRPDIATIHVNADGIFNDDSYEYETIGLPFFANLGQVVYDFEKKRKRKFKPDLSKFVVEGYD